MSANCSCNTCKASFEVIDLLKDHYRSEWHVFNSKRRSNALAPVNEIDFRKFSSTSKKGSNSSKTKVTANQRVPSSISTKSSTQIPAVTRVENESNTSDETKLINEDISRQPLESKSSSEIQSGSETLMETLQPISEINGISDINLESSQSEEHMIQTAEDIISPTISIFDNKKFDNIDFCIEYMEKEFGFFIPDREYVCDMEGFLTYLGEKVKLGGICLFCQKQFTPGRSCQDHMISKSHCKLAYEDDIDLEDLEEFYDFSALYEDVDEDDDDEEGSGDGDRILEISSIGELILFDGRTVGNRNLRIYYKQKYRPQDNRPSVLAYKQEELLKLGIHFNPKDNENDEYTNSYLSSREFRQLSDAQVVHLMMKKRQQLRKSEMIEQRAVQRHQYAVQRREYQSSINKLRSSATTTDKIRDWHRKI